MNPSTQYERLTTLRRNQSFDSEASHASLTLQFQSEPIVRIRTKGQRTFYLRRHLLKEDEHLIVYQVFVDERSAKEGENDVAFCRMTKPENGIATIVKAEVKEPFRKKGIAT
ncbi:MAG: N-acetyltransferase, partial [Hyphomicrobium denitrificans]|nr:N-acetyltransferase [Hyphomicrobium denitrificans]